MLNSDCNACHNAFGRFPVYLDSSTGGTGLEAISCMGCHGREEDNTVISGSGAGLRQHHWRAGEQGCLDCHDDANPANFTPVGEEILPPYYLADDPNHPLIPSDPCNPSADGFPENYAASNLGLDNDGNGLYDGEDLMACLAKGDVNGSGVADLADVILSLQVAGGMTPAGIVHKEADINNDQKVGIPEAVWIMSNSGR